MFKKLVPVNRERHGAMAIEAIDGFGFAKDFHLASLMVHEFTRAASVYPIVFVEDPNADTFRPIVLLGLDAGENLFVGEDGKWQASYIPAIIRRYPFALARTAEDGQFTVCVDEDSPLLADKADRGQKLFGDDGEPTEVIDRVKRYLGELQQMELFTQGFCELLSRHNLFTPLNMRVRQGDALKQITGCYVVNEERLNNLSDAAYLEMREKRYMAAVYAHLTSLSQIERLSMLKDGVVSLTPAEAEAKEAASDAGADTDPGSGNGRKGGRGKRAGGKAAGNKDGQLH